MVREEEEEVDEGAETKGLGACGWSQAAEITDVHSEHVTVGTLHRAGSRVQITRALQQLSEVMWGMLPFPFLVRAPDPAAFGVCSLQLSE